MSKFNLQNEIILRSIKLVDIGYIAALSFIIAYFFGYYLDRLFVYFYGTDHAHKSAFILSLEILSQIIAVGMVSYISRNVFELIPFPLNGIYGYDHLRLKEMKTPGGFLMIFLVMFQYQLQNKIILVRQMNDKLFSDGSK